MPYSLSSRMSKMSKSAEEKSKEEHQSMFVYTHIYICVCVCVCVCINNIMVKSFVGYFFINCKLSQNFKNFTIK